MKDMEERLRESEASEPSAELDRRIEALLTPRRYAARVPLWGALAACAASLALGWGLRAWSTRVTPSEAVRSEPARAIRAAGPAPRAAADPFLVPATRIEPFIILGGQRN